jgi:hypothetical protein
MASSNGLCSGVTNPALETKAALHS